MILVSQETTSGPKYFLDMVWVIEYDWHLSKVVIVMNQHGEPFRNLRGETRNGKEVAALILLG
jgi:hypothetical protein